MQFHSVKRHYKNDWDPFAFDQQTQYQPITKEISVKNSTLTCTFPPHSFTQIKLGVNERHEKYLQDYCSLQIKKSSKIMVALDIRSRNAITEVLDAMIRTSDHEADVQVSRLYAEHIHNLFNYGMNACDDQALVKNCIVELFLLIGGRSDLLREGASVDSSLVKMFRRILMQEIVTSRTSIENFFSVETQMTQGLTSLQREALFLKFQRRLSYREVANVMDITIEQLRSQISKAVDVLLHRTSKH